MDTNAHGCRPIYEGAHTQADRQEAEGRGPHSFHSLSALAGGRRATGGVLLTGDASALGAPDSLSLLLSLLLSFSPGPSCLFELGSTC